MMNPATMLDGSHAPHSKIHDSESRYRQHRRSTMLAATEIWNSVKNWKTFGAITATKIPPAAPPAGNGKIKRCEPLHSRLEADKFAVADHTSHEQQNRKGDDLGSALGELHHDRENE